MAKDFREMAKQYQTPVKESQTPGKNNTVSRAVTNQQPSFISRLLKFFVTLGLSGLILPIVLYGLWSLPVELGYLPPYAEELDTNAFLGAFGIGIFYWLFNLRRKSWGGVFGFLILLVVLFGVYIALLPESAIIDF